MASLSFYPHLCSLYCFQYQFQEFPLTSHFLTLGFSYSSNIDSFLSKKISFPVTAISFFLNNSFTEIKVTYHKTHFFKAYNSVVFSTEPQSVQTTTTNLRTFPLHKKKPCIYQRSLLGSTLLSGP